MNIETLSLIAQRDLLKSGEISSADLTAGYIARIKKYNSDLNIVIRENFDQALVRAKELDKFLAANARPVGPLHGVPFTIKDAFRIKGFHTSYGFPTFNYLPAFTNCTVFDRLIAAGAFSSGKQTSRYRVSIGRQIARSTASPVIH